MSDPAGHTPGGPGLPQERRLLTEIPGPVSRAKFARRQEHVAAGVGTTLPVFVEAAGGGVLVYADGNSLVGRFYLMHMICIRPEVAEFTIGSACDYSFIPEMCPSGNVDVVTDSDEYLVMEMQPRAHEAKFLRPGLEVGRVHKV